MSTSSKSSVRRGCGLDVSAANVVAAFLSWLVVTEPQGSPQSPLHAGKAEMAVAQSCPTPRTVVPPGCSGHGIPQARLPERVAVPCSKHAGGSCQSFVYICGCPGSEIISLGNCHVFQVLCWDSGAPPTSPGNRRQALPSSCGYVAGGEEMGPCTSEALQLSMGLRISP